MAHRQDAVNNTARNARDLGRRLVRYNGVRRLRLAGYWALRPEDFRLNGSHRSVLCAGVGGVPICHVLTSPKKPLDKVSQTLPQLQEPRTFEHVEGEFVDRIADVRVESSKKLTFVFEYHEAYDLEVGPDDIRHFVRRHRVDVAVTDPPRLVWFVHGSRGNATVTARFLGQGLYGDATALLSMTLSPNVLKELEKVDAADVKKAKFKNLDNEVKTASLGGSLSTSLKFRAMKREGTYTEIAYACRTVAGKRVRISTTGRVSMSGVGTTERDLELYIEKQILPRV